MAEQIVMTLFRISLISAVMTGAILLVRLLADKWMKAGLMSALWLKVLARLILPVTAESPVNLGGWLDVRPEERLAATAEAAEPAGTAAGPLVLEDAGLSESADIKPDAAEQPVPKRVLPDFLKVHLYPILLAAWLLGAGVFFGITGTRMQRFRRHVLRGRPLDIQWLKAALVTYKYWLGIRRDIRLIESPLVDVPVVMGVFRPVIILPQGLADSLDREQMRVIIFHELCHIKRLDLLKGALWLAAKGLHWFNPLVWAAYSTYRVDTEYACDAMVLKALNKTSVVVYSEALVAVMRRTSIKPAAPALVSFCKNSSILRKRVTNMLKPKKKSTVISAMVVMMMLVLAVGGFTTACMKDTEENSSADIYATEAETLEATRVASEDVSEKKTIRVNPVETPEAAIEIAKRFNISGAESFTYKGLNTGVMDAHMVSADDDTNTNYTIYAINGEILRMHSTVNVDNQPISITEDEAKAYAESYAKAYYGDVELTVGTCEASQGVRYLITGSIYKDSEGSTRSFATEISGSGKLISIFAAYDAIYALGIPDVMLEKVRSFGQANETMELINTRSEYGADSYTFWLRDSDISVTLDALDASLIGYLKAGVSRQGGFEKNQQEAETVVKRILADYIPLASGITFDSFDTIDGMAEISGSLTRSEKPYDFFLSINNDDILSTLELRPAFQKDDAGKISMEAAEELAKAYVIEDCSFIETNALVLKNAYESESENTLDQYMFEFSYTSGSPSVTNYSFTAEAGVNKYTGAFGTVRIDPDLTELDLISMDDAIEIAKNALAGVPDLNDGKPIEKDKLTYREHFYMAGYMLLLQINFDYEGLDHGFLCTMTPDDGLVDGYGY